MAQRWNVYTRYGAWGPSAYVAGPFPSQEQAREALYKATPNAEWEGDSLRWEPDGNVSRIYWIEAA